MKSIYLALSILFVVLGFYVGYHGFWLAQVALSGIGGWLFACYQHE